MFTQSKALHVLFDEALQAADILDTVKPLSSILAQLGRTTVLLLLKSPGLSGVRGEARRKWYTAIGIRLHGLALQP